MDKTSTVELLNFILESIKLIKRRFNDINTSDDFLFTNDGLDRLDAISMRIQAVGEALKNIHKRDKEFLLLEGTSDYWNNIIRSRDFISHHYVELDSEVIYMICDEKIDELEIKIKNLLLKINNFS
jgi:uncharacterized protein with HEPN domain